MRDLEDRMQQEEEGKRSACAASRCREVGGRSCCYCALSASFGVFLLYSVPTAERQETLCFPGQARQKGVQRSATSCSSGLWLLGPAPIGACQWGQSCSLAD